MEKEKKILRNRAQCNNCSEIVESTHRHHFVACSCYADRTDNKGIAVDGGIDYLRRCGDILHYIELSEYENA